MISNLIMLRSEKKTLPYSFKKKKFVRLSWWMLHGHFRRICILLLLLECSVSINKVMQIGSVCR